MHNLYITRSLLGDNIPCVFDVDHCRSTIIWHTGRIWHLKMQNETTSLYKRKKILILITTFLIRKKTTMFLFCEILITFTLKQILHGDVPISTCGISLRYVGFSYAQLEARGVWIIPVKEVKICLVKCLVYKCPQWVGVVCPYILWKAFKSYCMSHTVKQYTASIFSMLFSAVFKVLIIIIHLLWIHGSIFFTGSLECNFIHLHIWLVFDC